MKTRNGFVSNSSSSSFIVLFPHKPKTKEELKEIMFPKFKWDEIIEGDYSDLPTATVSQIVEKVFNDMKSGQKDRYNVSFKDAFCGYIDEIDEGDTITHLLYNRMIEDGQKECGLYGRLQNGYGEDKNKWSKNDPIYKSWVIADKEYKKAEREYYKERNSAVKKFYKSFKNQYKYHKYQHIFEYGDRYGEYIFENGYIFRNLPHLTISNH